MNDTMLIKKNSMTQRKFWMNFISYIQANRAKYRNNYQQKWAKKLHSCKHEFLKRRITLWAYQDWLELVNDLVEIWFKSDSDLTQIWLNTFFLSQHSFSFSTFFSFINIYIIFFSCYKHISFEFSTVFEHYINKNFCINLLLYF